MYEYRIHLHIHSNYSDGSLSIEGIAGLAEKAGLKAIVITDHGTLKGLHMGQEGYYGGVLVLIGMEINQDSHHYLALGIENEVADNEACPQRVIDEVNRQGGFGIIAHPFDQGCFCPPFSKSYPWTTWNVHGFQAIEVWNELSQWFAAMRGWAGILPLLLNPLPAVRHPEQNSMDAWDRFLAEGRVVYASAGSDAHGITFPLGPCRIKVSSYERGMQTLNTHILCIRPLNGRPTEDKATVLRALRQGRYWLANDRLADSSGFSFSLRDGARQWAMGDQAPFSGYLQAQLATPYEAWVKILRNGRLWRQNRGKRHIFTGLSPAVYRAEALIKRGWRWYTWIVSNPIWVVEPLPGCES